MKKHLLMIAVAILSASFLTSCNKGLKDDMKELEKKLAEEQAKNAKIRQNLGGDACASASFVTNDGTEAISLSEDFCLTAGNERWYTYMEDNGDGSYYVYIQKGSDFDDNYYAYIDFEYTPSTNTVDFSEAYIYLPWSGDGGTIRGYFYTDSEVTNTLNVTAFDFNAGTISLNYTGQSTASFEENEFSNQPMRMTFNYSGELFKKNYYAPTAGPSSFN